MTYPSKPTPTDIRRALDERLPRWRWLRRAMTWLTAIAMPDETRPRPWRAETHVAALLATWLATLAGGAWTVELLLRALAGAHTALPMA